MPGCVLTRLDSRRPHANCSKVAGALCRGECDVCSKQERDQKKAGDGGGKEEKERFGGRRGEAGKDGRERERRESES